MTFDRERKRARDRERQARLTAEGRRVPLRVQRLTMTPEQLAKADARQARATAWRQVGRDFDRLLTMPADVLDEAIRRVKEM